MVGPGRGRRNKNVKIWFAGSLAGPDCGPSRFSIFLVEMLYCSGARPCIITFHSQVCIWKTLKMKGNADFWQIVWPATNAVFFNDFDQNRPQHPNFFLASQGGRGRVLVTGPWHANPVFPTGNFLLHLLGAPPARAARRGASCERRPRPKHLISRRARRPRCPR